jgi:carbonic anhydrase
MERLVSFPFIADRIRSGDLEVNGARFGIADGRLEIFDSATKTFVVI